jgi:hypothetical protein
MGMALKFTLDTVVENKVAEKETQTYTAYVKLYDDADPNVILTNICLTYSTQEEFEIGLRNKVQKYKDSISSIETVKTTIASSLTNIEKEFAL